MHVYLYYGQYKVIHQYLQLYATALCTLLHFYFHDYNLTKGILYSVYCNQNGQSFVEIFKSEYLFSVTNCKVLVI